MKKNSIFLVLFIFASTIYGNKTKFIRNNTGQNNHQVSFTENKGQVSDQFYKPRPDVLFSGSTNGMVYHLRDNGISYQLSKVNSWKELDGPKHSQKIRCPKETFIYRLDVTWINSNSNYSIIKDKTLPGYNNYYLEACPKGVTNVKTYSGITYKNIYHNTDLHYYEKDGSLEYDFIVRPGGDYKKIKLHVAGSDKIELLKNGDLSLKTPLGNILQAAPIAYQNNKRLKSKWIITKSDLSFEIEGYDASQILIIDPVVRIWGTYYGGGSGEIAFGTCVDSTGNAFITGWSFSSTGTAVATSGSYQTVLGGGCDSFLAAFNSNGARQWGTYYGGIENDFGSACCSDGLGNIFICGYLEVASPSVIVTPSAHQTVYGGGTYDAFLVKFNSSGVRQWGTFYGGGGDERGNACTTDANGDVYLAGKSSTSAGTVMSTPSAFQLTGSGFLCKFNTNGVRLWATCYSGIANACAAEGNANVYLAGDFGVANSASLISSTSAHQVTYGGGTSDAFLAKFNSSGSRQWGTCYGGSGQDYGNGCTIDPSGNVYLCGATNTPTGTAIATALAHQTVYAGGTGPDDGFLVKFNSSGVRQWGTYYGGTYSETMYAVTSNTLGNIFVAGISGSSGTVIATPASHQTVNASSSSGILDGFLVKFDSGGSRDWGTFYGGSDYDYGYACTIDPTGAIYLGGATGSTGGIATSSAHQIAMSGTQLNAFLVKFFDCSSANAPQNITPLNNLSVCKGDTTTLSVSVNGFAKWYSSATSTIVLSTGTTINTPTLNTGVISFYVSGNDCPAVSRTAITITVNPTPTIAVSNGTICSGDSIVISPSGAATYSISGGTFTVNPTQTNTYSITGSSSVGCVSTNTAISIIQVNPLPVISANSGFICIGDPFLISPSGAYTYTITGGVYFVTPTITTSYSITGTSNLGCVSSNTAISTIIVNTVFPLVTVNSGSICAGKSFTLNPGGASTYIFSSGGAVVSPFTTSQYTVTGTDVQTNCKSTAVSTVVVKPLPVLSAIADPSLICNGEMATISVSGADTYTWNSGDTASSITVNPINSITYSVTGTASNSCTNKTTVALLVSECTSIQTLSELGRVLLVYPNPNQGNFYIKTSESENLSIEMFNTLGELVLAKKLDSEINEIALKEVSNGVYIMLVYRKNEIIRTYKVAKE